MVKVTRGKRASEKQKEYLVNYLEENVDLANDKFITADDAKFREEKWKVLAASLNALGGSQKDGGKWRKYWSDLRLHTRAKNSGIKQAQQRSGINGLRKFKVLSQLEQRIIKITSAEAIDGDDTQELKFQTNLADITDGLVEPSTEDTVFDMESSSSAATDVIIINNNSSDVTTAGFAATQSRRLKRRAQPKTPQFEKIFKIEGKKLAEMELANNLKREQIALLREQIKATKEQTQALKADTQVKRNIIAKIQNVIAVLEKNNLN